MLLGFTTSFYHSLDANSWVTHLTVCASVFSSVDWGGMWKLDELIYAKFQNSAWSISISWMKEYPFLGFVTKRMGPVFPELGSFMLALCSKVHVFLFSLQSGISTEFLSPAIASPNFTSPQLICKWEKADKLTRFPQWIHLNTHRLQSNGYYSTQKF